MDFNWYCNQPQNELEDTSTPRRYLLHGEIELRAPTSGGLLEKRVLFIAHSPPPLESLKIGSWEHHFSGMEGGVFANFPKVARALNYRYWSIVNMHPRISPSSASVIHECEARFADRNWEVIKKQCALSDAIIACWGHTETVELFPENLSEYLKKIKKEARIFGRTNDKPKQPKHIRVVSVANLEWENLQPF